MKILVILLVLLSNQLQGQVRKFYFAAGLSVSTFSSNIAIGPMFDIEVLDETFPLVINFRNGLLFGTRHNEFMWELSAGRRFDKKKGDGRFTDIGGVFGFTGYLPRTNYIVPVGFYSTIHIIKNLSTRVEFVYNLNRLDNYDNINTKFGVNVNFSYRLKHCKKL